MIISLCEKATACMPRDKDRKTKPQKAGNPIERFSEISHLIGYDLDDPNFYVCSTPTSRKVLILFVLVAAINHIYVLRIALQFITQITKNYIMY